MRTLLPKLLFVVLLICSITQSAQSACSVSFTKSISVHTVSFTNTSSTTSGFPNMMTYYWDFGDGTFSIQKNPVKTYSTGGPKMVTLMINDSFGCTAMVVDTFFLESDTSCSASFSHSLSSVELTIELTNTSLNSIGTSSGLSYFWDFGDGTTSTYKNITKQYETPGPKAVRLTITDSVHGCTSTMIDTVFLYHCAAAFYTTKSGLSVTFTNASTNVNGSSVGLSYHWDFGDSTSSTLKDPVKTYATEGYKIVKLTISDSALGCFSTITESIFISAINSCAASFSSTTSGSTVTFTNTSTNTDGTSTGLSYFWHFGDGTYSTLKNPVKTYTMTGNMGVVLEIRDSAQQCYSNVGDTIFVSSGNNCAAAFYPTISGLSVTFTNTSTNTNGTSAGLSYHWSFGDGTFSTLKNPSKTYTTVGPKIIQLTINDSAQGCFSTVIDSIFLSTSNNCLAAYYPTIRGLSVTFTNTSTNTNGSSAGLSYHWDFGDGTISTLKNPVKTYDRPGAKPVRLMISDSAQGCFSMVHDTILITAPLCEANFSLAIDTATPFLFYILNTSIIRPTSNFFWDFGDGATSNLMIPTHTYSSFGTYYVCLTVSDTVCTSTYCDSIGMDSTGRLLKSGAFGFKTLDYTTQSTVTGINTAKEITHNMQIHPNPTAGEFTINFTSEMIAEGTIQISDITGKVLQATILNTSIGENTKTIDISSLKPSIYFVHIATANSYKVFKIIKQ